METNYYENLIAINNKEAETLIKKQNNTLDELIDSFILLRERQKNEEKKNNLNTKHKAIKDDDKPISFLEYID